MEIEVYYLLSPGIVTCYFPFVVTVSLFVLDSYPFHNNGCIPSGNIRLWKDSIQVS